MYPFNLGALDERNGYSAYVLIPALTKVINEKYFVETFIITVYFEKIDYNFGTHEESKVQN